MNDAVLFTHTIGIRDAGFDEYWLQDQIVANPSILGMGDLEAIGKERKQSSGGRIAILLKDQQDDSMYEVEVMLGETDETHIVRTIEYWDNEKRRWPQRQHYAVLVAESITRRFFNVVQLLSHSIPIIAIQVSLVELGGKRALHFTKILDSFEEIDDGTGEQDILVNKDYWLKKAKWTVEAAESLNSVTSSVLNNGSISYLKNYISIIVGRNNYFFLHKRSGNKSLVGFRIASHLTDEATDILDAAKISFVKKPRVITFTTDSAGIQQHADVFSKLAELTVRTWAK